MINYDLSDYSCDLHSAVVTSHDSADLTYLAYSTFISTFSCEVEFDSQRTGSSFEK